jgi:hypothetical protein
VAEEFSGRVADFCGGVERSRMATSGPALGFPVRNPKGKYRSSVIRVDPIYTGEVNAARVLTVVKESNC